MKLKVQQVAFTGLGGKVQRERESLLSRSTQKIVNPNQLLHGAQLSQERCHKLCFAVPEALSFSEL